MARFYARWLPRFLPGNPTAIVRNIPGGDTTIGANFAYAAKPDGMTLLSTAGSVYMADLFDKAAAKFSLREMTALVAVPVPSTVYVRPNLIDKPEDIVKAKGVVFGQNTGSTTAIYFVLAKEFIGIPTDKVVLAYSGEAEGRRAFMAGEINASSESVSNYTDILKPLVEKGEAKLLYQTGSFDDTGAIVRHPVLPPYVPTLGQLHEKIHGKPPTGTAWEAYRALFASTASIDKALFLPPKATDSIKRVYWTTVETMIKSPDFQKDAERIVGPGSRLSAGENFDKMVKREFGLQPEIRDWLKNFLSAKYGMVI